MPCAKSNVSRRALGIFPPPAESRGSWKLQTFENATASLFASRRRDISGLRPVQIDWPRVEHTHARPDVRPIATEQAQVVRDRLRGVDPREGRWGAYWWLSAEFATRDAMLHDDTMQF